MRSLREEFSRPSEAWQAEQEPLVAFWVDSGECWFLPFFGVIGACYHPDEQLLSIGFSIGSMIIRGPKVLDFAQNFAKHKATQIIADGQDILSVTFQSAQQGAGDGA